MRFVDQIFAHQTFGVLIFQGVEELDFVGPWEMVTVWNKEVGGPKGIIVAQDCQPIICAKGMSVNPHVSFDTCPKLDYLLIPGGTIVIEEGFLENDKLINFVKKQAETCQAVLSVCTGSFILHKAGLLLKGMKATTYWDCLSKLRALGDVTVVEERYTRDTLDTLDTLDKKRKIDIWCSAGVSAGTDMTLKFIADIVAENPFIKSPIVGEEVAGKVQQWTEYYPSSVTYGLYTKNSQAPAYIRKA